jgi:ethanolamine kinase
MEVLYVETNTFRLASHIYWALWALIQVSKVIDPAHMIFFFWIA